MGREIGKVTVAMSGGGCHNHGGCEHGQAGAQGEESGVQYSLYLRIDKEKLTCLNETTENSGRTVFKAWEDRFDKTANVESGADEELLFNIPFTGNVKLKGLKVIGGEEDSHPDRVKLFKNRPNMTFDDASSAPDQEFALVPDPEGSLEYKTKVVTFSSVHHLTLYFPSNMGADQTKIYYIGLSGEWTKATRVGVVNAVYEARPMIQDHQQDVKEGVGSSFGGGGPAF